MKLIQLSMILSLVNVIPTIFMYSDECKEKTFFNWAGNENDETGYCYKMIANVLCIIVNLIILLWYSIKNIADIFVYNQKIDEYKY